MANWTKTSLINGSLEAVGAKPAGQAASAEDQATAEAVIDSVFDQLRYIGLVSFSVEAIPEYAQQPLKKIMAYELAASDFDVSDAKFARLERGEIKARRQLQTQAEKSKDGTQVRKTYF